MGKHAELLGRHTEVLPSWMALYYEDPISLVDGEGRHVTDAEGNTYLDFFGGILTTMSGYRIPAVVNAIKMQADRMLHTSTLYLIESQIELAEKIAGLSGIPDAKVFFTNSGSEANDVASQIVKHRTSAHGLLMMEGAYHGMTEAVLEISDEEFVSRPPNVAAITAPDGFRHAPATPAGAADETESAIGGIKEAGHDLAGFFVDPAMTSSGIPDVPRGFIDAIAGAVRAHGGLVVSDEVQSGFGRTGVMWGHDREQFVPDMVTIGKPVANGQPLGVVVTRREILDGFMEQSELFSTFGGNPVSCAAGLAVLDVIENDGLVANSAAVGQYLKDSLNRLAKTQSLIGDVRGSGLLVGLELVSDRDNKTPAVHETALLVELLREAGVLVGTADSRRSSLKLRPPLVVRPRHVDLFIEALDSSLDEVDRQRA